MPELTAKEKAQQAIIEATQAYTAAIRRNGLHAGMTFEQMARFVSAVEQVEVTHFITPVDVDPEKFPHLL